MARPYFMLCVREDGRWSPQFGDYSRAVVAQEAVDSYSDYPRVARKIVRCSGDGHSDIAIAVAELNDAP
jgi:orotidine-5'-phosphate decarboxylase